MVGREKEKDRNINVWLPLTCPLLGTWPTTQVCALTWKCTSNPLVHRLSLNPHWAKPARAESLHFNQQLLIKINCIREWSQQKRKWKQSRKSNSQYILKDLVIFLSNSTSNHMSILSVNDIQCLILGWHHAVFERPITKWVDPKTMVYLHNGILRSREKEGAYTLCSTMDGTGEHYVKWNKQDGEGQIPCDLTFNWNIINRRKNETKYNQRHWS